MSIVVEFLVDEIVCLSNSFGLSEMIYLWVTD